MIQRWWRQFCDWCSQPLWTRQQPVKLINIGVLYQRSFRFAFSDSLLLWVRLNPKDYNLVSYRVFLGQSSSWAELPEFYRVRGRTALFLSTLEKKSKVLKRGLYRVISDEEFSVFCWRPELLAEAWEQERRGNTEPICFPNLRIKEGEV